MQYLSYDCDTWKFRNQIYLALSKLFHCETLFQFSLKIKNNLKVTFLRQVLCVVIFISNKHFVFTNLSAAIYTYILCIFTNLHIDV